MTDEDAQKRQRRFDRRRYLTAVGLGAATATAGCTVSFEDGIKIEFGNSDDETQTPTDVGYGGTATATTAATAATTATQTATDDSTDNTDSPSSTDTETTEPEDDYGETGYGRLDYGG